MQKIIQSVYMIYCSRLFKKKVDCVSQVSLLTDSENALHYIPTRIKWILKMNQSTLYLTFNDAFED